MSEPIQTTSNLQCAWREGCPNPSICNNDGAGFCLRLSRPVSPAPSKRCTAVYSGTQCDLGDGHEQPHQRTFASGLEVRWQENPPSNSRNDLLEKAVNFLRAFHGAHDAEALAVDELRIDTMRVRDFLEFWIYEGRLDLFEDRKKFRREAKALLWDDSPSTDETSNDDAARYRWMKEHWIGFECKTKEGPMRLIANIDKDLDGWIDACRFNRLYEPSAQETSPPHPGPSIEKAFARSPRRVVDCGNPVMVNAEWYGPCTLPSGHEGDCKRTQKASGDVDVIAARLRRAHGNDYVTSCPDCDAGYNIGEEHCPNGHINQNFVWLRKQISENGKED